MRRSVQQIAEEIQRYTDVHPEACDTVDGIVWWIHIQREQDMKEDVAYAVDLLVKQGVLLPYDLPDGSRVFGRPLPRSGKQSE